MKAIIALALLVVAICSCQKKRTLPADNATTPEKILAAQDEALAKLDPYKIQSGQKVYKIESQEIFSSQEPIKALSKEWITEVTEIENSQFLRLITTNQQVVDHLKDKDFVYEFKNVLTLDQPEIISSQQEMGLYELFPNSLRQSSESSEINSVSFQNLQVSEVTLVPPEAVAKASNCKNIQNCRIRADRISYDVLYRADDGNIVRFKNEWLISNQVPFFASILRQCVTNLVPYESQRLLVKQCREVVDFDSN